MLPHFTSSSRARVNRIQLRSSSTRNTALGLLGVALASLGVGLWMWQARGSDAREARPTVDVSLSSSAAQVRQTVAVKAENERRARD